MFRCLPALGLLVVASLALAQTPQVVPQEVPPQVLLSVGQGAQPGLVNIDAKNVMLCDLLRMIAKQTNTNILIAADVRGEVEAVALRDVTADAAYRLIAKTQNLSVNKDGPLWIFTIGDSEPEVALALRVIQLPKPAANSIDVAGPAGPNLGIMRGRFDAQVHALVASGRATIVNEPHVATRSGRQANLSFFGDSSKPLSPSFDGAKLDTVTQSFQVLPRIKEDGTIDLDLSIETRWWNRASGARNVLPGTGESDICPADCAATLKLPRLNVRDGEEILLYGWQPLVGQAIDADDRQTILLVQVSKSDNH